MGEMSPSMHCFTPIPGILLVVLPSSVNACTVIFTVRGSVGSVSWFPVLGHTYNVTNPFNAAVPGVAVVVACQSSCLPSRMSSPEQYSVHTAILYTSFDFQESTTDLKHHEHMPDNERFFPWASEKPRCQ